MIYRAGRKHRLNLHPEGDAARLVIDVSEYGESVLWRGRGVPEELVPAFRKALSDFGVGADRIHDVYRVAAARDG